MRIVDIKVWGDYACFTRPEFKVERVSYPVMTPSAARGVLEAIYWKPQMRYRVERIGILRHPCLEKDELPIGREWSLLRNEISSRQSEGGKDFYIEDDRQQRTSLVLKDVAYRIQAWIEPRNGETNIAKHLDTFRRRAVRGQYFHKPFLGCREFAADFEWLGDKPENDDGSSPDSKLNLPLGSMLYDTAYISDTEHYIKHKEDRLEFLKHDNDEAYVAKGYAQRYFFDAEIKNGWLVEKNSNKLPDSIYQMLTKVEVAND